MYVDEQYSGSIIGRLLNCDCPLLNSLIVERCHWWLQSKGSFAYNVRTYICAKFDVYKRYIQLKRSVLVSLFCATYTLLEMFNVTCELMSAGKTPNVNLRIHVIVWLSLFCFHRTCIYCYVTTTSSFLCHRTHVDRSHWSATRQCMSCNYVCASSKWVYDGLKRHNWRSITADPRQVVKKFLLHTCMRKLYWKSIS